MDCATVREILLHQLVAQYLNRIPLHCMDCRSSK